MPAGGFTTLDDFFAACDKIKAAGKTCLAMGPAWTSAHLWENIMIGTLGADGWSKLWQPGADWTSADVTKGLNNFAKALSYTNSDASTLSDWQPAAKLMIDGDAAFNIMGDWAYGYFANPAPNGLALTPAYRFRLDRCSRNAGHLQLPVRQLCHAGECANTRMRPWPG